MSIPLPIARSIGLGDVLKKTFSFLGIRSQLTCGCNDRAAKLNRAVLFAGYLDGNVFAERGA